MSTEKLARQFLNDKSRSIIAATLPTGELPVGIGLPMPVNRNLDFIEQAASPDFKPAMVNQSFVHRRVETATGMAVKKVLIGTDFLPMPQNIEVSYPKSWSQKSTLSEVGSGAGGFDKTVAFLKKKGISMVETMAPDDVVAETYYQKGIAVDDKKKLLFTGLDFRTFNFSIKFQPKNAVEQVMVQDYIADMKMRSAPRRGGGSYFEYPDFFQLDFPRLGNLFGTGELAMTNITVNYTPDGMWTEHTDGKPTATLISLAYTEVELADKAKIGKGW